MTVNANSKRPAYKTRNIRDLVRAADNNAQTHHDPYRWSRKLRPADRILDTPGPSVSEHQA